ncbi:hypothetical protein TH63_09410 [Rufibacter radiotolerans]|uniref:Uncharacterized protein n=1 Tax=Rufibacter radiotolerans TaxID=1379910 RepID=A0A0H4W5V0_9BACT|nr:hypothetical protein [Rufibacter radiotolerans]AKQ45811.1 hypothetical protein TH63_09410 [Rufibacter radiotolerans]
MSIDFNQARTKHMFFKARVRGFLLGSEANPENFKAYLKELGSWVEALATRFHLETDEVMEANYLHNELTDKTNGLIKFWNSGKESEAKEKFLEIESTGEQFMDTLSRLEKRMVNR